MQLCMTQNNTTKTQHQTRLCHGNNNDFSQRKCLQGQCVFALACLLCIAVCCLWVNSTSQRMPILNWIVIEWARCILPSCLVVCNVVLIFNTFTSFQQYWLYVVARLALILKRLTCFQVVWSSFDVASGTGQGLGIFLSSQIHVVLKHVLNIRPEFGFITFNLPYFLKRAKKLKLYMLCILTF